MMLYEGKHLEASLPEHKLDAYFPDEKLVKAVQIAQLLQRPLLVRGEPGCGKTRLAEAIAFELHRNSFREYYFRWNIKSNTKAEEGLYLIDHLRYLRDVQNPKIEEQSIVYPEKYLIKGKIYETYLACHKAKAKDKPPAVLLIDEIDKADIDFPNDLLNEMEQHEFEIKEYPEGSEKRWVKAELAPIIIITSNDEKPLSDAFLRRCVYHYIEFPDADLLRRICWAKFSEEEKKKLYKDDSGEQSKFGQLIQKFLDERSNIENEALGPVKKPSTSELLDLMRIINYDWLREGNNFELENLIEKYKGVVIKNFEQSKKS